jgi:hypothetical protein
LDLLRRWEAYRDSHPFEAGDFASEIFIVPVGRDDSGTEYEAIFN